MASRTRGMLPSGRTTPAFSARPTSVPTVSKMLMMSNEKITMAMSRVKRPLKSNWQKIGSSEWGADTGSHPSGKTVTPSGMPITVARMMAMKSDPLTRRAMSTPLKRMAMMPSIASGVNLPRATNVSGFDTMMWAFLRPMKAMNMPIPAEMEWRKLTGMLSRIFSRMFKKVIRTKITPSTNKAANDCCHVRCMA